MSTELPPASPTPTANRRGRSQSLVILVVLLVVGGPLLYSYGRQELASWHLAAGYEHMLSHNMEAAIAEIEKAIRYQPQDAILRIRRVSWKMQTGELESVLDESALALDLARAAYGSRNTPQAHRQLATALNQRAYLCALSETNLEEALDDVEQAIGMLGNDFGFLDTRGYIHLKLGNVEDAQRDLEDAVNLAEASFKGSMMQIRRQCRNMVDTRPADVSERVLRESLAVLTHHRGELYEQLNRPEDAERDITRAIKMGYDPETGVW